MATGTALFLLAVGAILTFAVDATVAGLDIDAVGIILMIAGLIGVFMSLVWMDGLGGIRRTRTTTVVDRPATVVRQSVPAHTVVRDDAPVEVVERRTISRRV